MRVGITAYAQDQLGDVVFVELPKVGEAVEAGAPLGEVESTKSVSEIFAPVSGEVTAVNTALDESPELINSDPYGEGWIVEITADRPERPRRADGRGRLPGAHREGLTAPRGSHRIQGPLIAHGRLTKDKQAPAGGELR